MSNPVISNRQPCSRMRLKSSLLHRAETRNRRRFSSTIVDFDAQVVGGQGRFHLVGPLDEADAVAAEILVHAQFGELARAAQAVGVEVVDRAGGPGTPGSARTWGCSPRRGSARPAPRRRPASGASCRPRAGRRARPPRRGRATPRAGGRTPRSRRGRGCRGCVVISDARIARLTRIEDRSDC